VYYRTIKAKFIAKLLNKKNKGLTNLLMNKKIKLIFLFLIIFLFGKLAFSNETNIKLNISGIKDLKGNLQIAIYNNSEYFLKEGHLFQGKIIKIDKPQITTYFDNIPSGNYAISIYQDINKNNKLDTNIFGIPTEKYGFSNNAKGSFGPPSFKESQFSISDDKSVTMNIELR
jgi:uncharacterized protein (DUF2141 family)